MRMSLLDKVFMGCLVLFVAFVLGGVVYSLTREVATYDDVVACEAKRMKALRHPITYEVDCVPFPTRQDTITLNGEIR